MLISPLSLVLSGKCFGEPPNNKQETAFLMSWFPKIEIPIESTIF